MHTETKFIFNLFLRYLIILFSGISNLFLFYLILTPLTVYSVYFILNLFFSVTISGSNIHFSNSFVISIIPGCVAGAAYYLLFMLNLSVPKIKFLRRIAILSIAFISFFVVNILRIFFLSVIYYYDFPFSDIIHEFSWYFGSIILTVGIWFSEVYFFKIKEVPFYSDLNYFYKRSIFNKK